MKKTTKTSTLFIIITVFTISFFCCKGPVKTNVITSSFNIKESKDKNVFIFQYLPNQTGFQFKEGDSLIIEEIWVEKNWKYKDLNENIEILNSKQGFIKLNNVNLFDLEVTCNNVKTGISGNKLSFKLDNYSDHLSLVFTLKDNIKKEIILSKL